MILSRKNVIQRIGLSGSAFLLVVLLSACGGLGSSTANTPTPPSATPTPTPSPTPSIQLQTYTGASFSIGYPQDWKQQNDSGAIAFTDALGINALTIILVPNPGGIKSADTIAAASLATFEAASLKGAKPATGLPPTASVGGETWVELGATGDVSEDGQTIPGEVILLVDNHPANSPTTQAYEIYFGGAAATFAQTNSTIFQAMLQSFKFTA